MIKRVLLDYDGTLICHNSSTEANAIAKYLKIEPTEQLRIDMRNFYEGDKWHFYGEPVTMEKYKAYMYQKLSVVASGEVSCDDYLAAMAYCGKYNSKLDEHTKDILEYLTGVGYTLYLVTNGFYEFQLESLRHWKIDQYFERIYSWDNVCPKPDMNFFLRAFSGMNPEEVVMIGDHEEHDIIPAVCLGIHTIGVRCGIDTAEHTIEELHELKNLL